MERIPVEIWRRVFSLVCLPDSVLFPGCSRRVRARPYSLLCVCTHWRRIVSEFPQLWASISISGDFSTDFFPHLDNLLRKSRNSPLTIRISFHYFVDHRYLKHEYHDSAGDCIAFIAKHALNRCRHLITNCNLWEFINSRAIDVSFPALEYLETDIPYWSSGPSLSLDAPILTRLKIRDPYYQPGSDKFLPYGSLTSLEFGRNDDIKPHEFIVKVLPLCSNLQSLTVPFGFASIDHHGHHCIVPEQPIGFPSLKHLRIRIAWFRYDLISLFKHFEFPNLSSFEIEWSVSYRDRYYIPPLREIDPHFPPAFYRSLLGLEKLKLRFDAMDDPHEDVDYLTSLPEILEATSSITDLELIQNSATIRQFSVLLTPLTIGPDGLTVVPKLSSLFIFHGATIPCFRCTPSLEAVAGLEKCLLDMVEGRAKHAKAFDLRLEYSESVYSTKNECDDHGISGFYTSIENRMQALKEYPGLKCRIREAEKAQFRAVSSSSLYQL
ncbi:hypothetical protein E1B28_009433 [Marasmius oreades]|uniref:F-box domain-containing protein n=1 Tax=Marasmius oreades TaxID=181124 RepID=A0A9P7S0P4_9AGAR|nr:uncharacterized protein E1B28_009433 [Marasmius oreades]KAG7093150.1 hypothetical protein E1B28_009433 [Marasmius oreades]